MYARGQAVLACPPMHIGEERVAVAASPAGFGPAVLQESCAVHDKKKI